MPILTIDGREYDSEELSDSAKSHITNLQLTDQKIAQIQQDLIIFQTARNAYAAALKSELPIV